MQPKRTLIKFFHGLGDVMQFTSVLRHLKKYRSDWAIDILTTRGKHSAFVGLCENVFIDGIDNAKIDEGSYHNKFDVMWYENYNGYTDRPNSKVTNSLAEEFRVDYDKTLARYEIRYSAAAYQRAHDWLVQTAGATKRRDGRLNSVIIHYEGNTSAAKKNLNHSTIGKLCKRLLACGFVPVILDWDNRSPLPDGKAIHKPSVGAGDLWGEFGSGDAAMIAALIEASSLFVGIDSGPGKVASACDTLNISVWTGHHPIQFHDPSPSTLHLVPRKQIAPADKPEILAYFIDHYNHAVYDDLDSELLRQVGKALGEENFAAVEECSSHKDSWYYDANKQEGLDYMAYGDWQKEYGRWLVNVLALDGKYAVDVGCACGALTQSLAEAGAQVDGIDVDEYMIRLGRERFTACRLFVGDAMNLHMVRDEVADLHHSSMCLHEMRESQVMVALEEAARVLRPGGIMVAVLRTEGAPHRNSAIKPLAWWEDKASMVGLWHSAHHARRLTESMPSRFRALGWSLLVAAKK
jgi:ubiquinone/menaquinone biosynthesis C-methylase UbiE/ADP-heptose:LPS heptosyltransferase